MSKHTPGPWEADGNLGFTIIDNSDTIICQMPYTMTAMQHYANARLIAAAPEMLELLTDLSQAYDDSQSGHELASRLYDLRCVALRLLAKIEGGGDGA